MQEKGDLEKYSQEQNQQGEGTKQPQTDEQNSSSTEQNPGQQNDPQTARPDAAATGEECEDGGAEGAAGSKTR